jgi:signal transduction histidine kinase
MIERPVKASDGDDPIRRSGRMSTRTAAWIAWSLCGLSLTLATLGLLFLALGLAPPGVHVFSYWSEVTVFTVTFSTVGAFVASRRPGHPVGWLFCALGLLSGVDLFCGNYAIFALLERPATLPAGEAAAWLRGWIWVVYLGVGMFLVLLFPNGRLPSRRWRPIAWFSVTVSFLAAIAMAFAPGRVDGLGPIENPLGFAPLGIVGEGNINVLVEAIDFGLFTTVALTSLLARWRRSRDMERQQIKWFMFAQVAIVAGTILSYTVTDFIDVPWWARWGGYLFTIVGLAGLPVGVAIAILRYRLYDIDLIINRTLVYGTLTAAVVGLYVLIVGTLGALFQTRADFVVSLLATGVIAVLFAPLRGRLQRGVNRLMYGERDDPYAVLSRLGRRLEATIAPEAALTTIVETVAQALKLPYAAIVLQEGGGFRSAAAYGSPTGEPQAFPLIYQREEIGRLVISPRAPGEEFSSADRSLLEDLARQAEVAVHAVRLTSDLQRSRERLVTTREEERRRLRRDLHDGLGPTLGGLTLGLDVARSTITRDPRAAKELLSELKGQTQEAVSDIRRLVYGLRPPALDDLGLVAAIRQQAAKYGRLLEGGVSEAEAAADHGNLYFSVEAPEPLPPLPAAVEVACYRIAQEAINNVSRHAKASSCRVSISLDEQGEMLELEIADDGVGIPKGRLAGVGTSSMRERTEELGGTLTIELTPEGDTRVLARLPMFGEGGE